MSWSQRVASVATALVLCACGGGGGSDSPPPANAAPVIQLSVPTSAVAGTKLVLDARATRDPEGDALSFEWLLEIKPTGSTPELKVVEPGLAELTPDMDGSYAVKLTVRDAKGAQSTSSSTWKASPAPAIELSLTEPVSGTTTLRVLSVTQPVQWYVNTTALGSASADAVSWPTAALVNGSYQLLARWTDAAGRQQELQRTVRVGNSPISARAETERSSDRLLVRVHANAPTGIRKVTLAITGQAAQSLGSPNDCAPGCPGALQSFAFTLNPPLFPSGRYEAAVNIEDGAGNQRRVTHTLAISNAPLIQLDSPADRDYVSEQLLIKGRASSDKAGDIKVEVKLGDVVLAAAATASFQIQHALTGLPAGEYRLQINASDADGQVSRLERHVVVAGAEKAQTQSLMTLPPLGRVLGLQDGLLMYAQPGRGVVLRALTNGQETLLEHTADRAPDAFVLGNGRVHALLEAEADCPMAPGNGCAYEWSLSGRRSKLANVVGAAARTPAVFTAKAGHLLWRNELYRLRDEQFFALPLGDFVFGIDAADMALADNGDLRLAYSANGRFGMRGLLFWQGPGSEARAVGRTPTSGPQVTSNQLAWLDSVDAGRPNSELRRIVTPSWTEEVLASDVRRFVLKPGLLAWEAISGRDENALSLQVQLGNEKVLVGALQSRLASQELPPFLATESTVLFMQDKLLRQWTASNRQARVVLGAAPDGLWLDGSTVVFQLGDKVFVSRP